MKWVQARIGPRQLDYSYVWKTLLLHARADELAESLKGTAVTSEKSSGSAKNGTAVYVAGGSDAPIESPNPFTGIYDAMFRTNKNRIKSTEGEEAEIIFKPEECLSFSQALWIYTVGERKLTARSPKFEEEVCLTLPFLLRSRSGGAYASATEQRMGQIAPGFVADLVLVDPSVLTHPQHLHGLLPDAVLVGGQLTVANRLYATEGDALPELVRCDQVLPASVEGQQAATGALSAAVFLPGRGGRPLPANDALSQLSYCIPSEKVLRLPRGLKCACILRGKHCSDTFSDMS